MRYKSTNNKCWRGCEEKGALLQCWWVCKLVQPLWRTGWRFLKKLKIELPYDPSWQIDGETMETVTDFILVTEAMKLEDTCSWKKSYDQPRHHIKKQRHHFANKDPSNQSYGFPSSHVWMWELDYKESWAPKNWRFWIVVLEKTLESPLNCMEIQPVHLKGNQSWIFIGRTDADAEALILWPPDVKNWLIWKDPDAGKDWRQEEKGTEDETVGQHHQPDGHEFE